MRDEWRTFALGDISTVVTSGSRGWAEYYSATGCAFVRMGNIRRSSIELDISDLKFVKLPKESSEGTRTQLQSGDILISITAELGKVAYVRALPTPQSYISQHVCLVRIEHEQAVPDYVAYLLSSEPERQRLNRLNDAGAKAGLNLQTISRFGITVPPLLEQRKIADVLRTWDVAIEKLEALRETNLQRRIWLRSHLFTGRTRLPGYTGEWREVTLGTVLTDHGLQGTGAEEVFSVSVHKGLINQIEHLGRSFAAAETGHYNRVLPGDIVYTKSPTGDFPLGIIKQSKISQEVIVSPLYGVFTPTTRALGVILDALFESPIAVRNYLHPLVQKGAKNTIAITNRRFLEGKLILPMDPAEQSAIAAVVEVSQAELTAIEAEIEALTRQKRGLMQKLLTGEWRVNLDGDAHG